MGDWFLMTSYSPLYIKAYETGLVKSRQNFILPNDAYPVLENAHVWRERIIRKRAYQLLGRLTRSFDDLNIGLSGISPWTFNLLTVTGFILTANNANPGQVTTRYAHGLQTGDIVTISGVQGATGYNSTFTITVIDSTNFTIGADATSFGIYTSGGIFYSNRSLLTTEPNATIQQGSVTVYVNPTASTGTIIGYNNTTNCEVFTSSPHGLTTGDSISISGVTIVPQSGENAINGGPYVISVVTPTSFTINRSSLTWGIYQSGGIWTKIIASQKFVDDGKGNLILTPTIPFPPSGTIDYISGSVTIDGATAGQPTLVDFNYYPALPVMGIRKRDLQNATNDQTVFFDQKYAYIYNNGFQEFLPGTVWTGNDYEFFWTTNYWIDRSGNKIFWETNYSTSGDPIRYTNGNDGTNWIDFKPQINSDGDTLLQALCLLPFRGRFLAFNTKEGSGKYFTNRIRWAAIGTPFTTTSSIITTVNANAWRDDIRGQGGFLDIPTNEDIVSVGFVRDNCVIYCENSTWQLRYTGRTIAPFQIERVNSELGSGSTFSAVQFDTSLIGIGDKGIVECDSFKSERIDIKIPDFVFELQDQNNGQKRIHGIRDFINRLAYWTYCSEEANGIFPDKRLVYNYENDSWAIFTDSLTTLGTFQEPSNRTWVNTNLPWIQCNFPWVNQPATVPVILGGNQQGFIEQLDETTTNDPSLFISAINSNSPNATIITSPNHNMQTGFVIKITNIPEETPFATALNNNIFGIVVTDANNFTIFSYDPLTKQFSNPQVSTETGYIGGGLISVRDNFNITSKKFNFLEDGQNIQLGHMDILMNSTGNENPGAISMNIFLDYNDDEAINIEPQNTISDGISPDRADTFFNEIIPTSPSKFNNPLSSKLMHRVFCAVRGNFFTIKFTFNNEQMAGIEQELDVQIDTQILWVRKAGTLNPN